MSANIDIPKVEIAGFCRRYRIRSLALFGSAVRDDFSSDSDVDVLVEFEAGHTPGLAFFRMQRELAEIFDRPVDLNTIGFLSTRFRQEILDEAQVVYDAA
jgi:hypothetical protein